MTPGQTKLYIVAMYYNEPGFTGLFSDFIISSLRMFTFDI